jgi:class 3 adenylate cyclase
MARVPTTRYAKSGDLSIAYQVIGDGEIDLVLVPGIVSHVEFAHELPGYSEYLNRLASFARVITFDKRGQGLSDRVADMPSLEERIDDVRAVMDAVGVERAALMGMSEGGPMSVLFAATHPERTIALILYETFARFLRAPDWPGMLPEAFEAMVDEWVDGWGEGYIGLAIAPSMPDDDEHRALSARFERLSSTPGSLRRLWEMVAEIDVRPLLPSVRVPTLVLHGHHSTVPIRWGEALAAAIPNARLDVFDSADHAPWMTPVDHLVPSIENFLTGRQHSQLALDRTLATVLFTDIVGSTEQAAEKGDRRWTELLDRHDAIARSHVGRHRGRLVKSTGDGLLATFDGPARAIQAARDIRSELSRVGLDIRAGLHTGEIEMRGDDVGGIAVHVAARVESKAAPGEVVVSRTVVDLVAGSGLEFSDRGEHELKGVPGSWQLFAVV